MTRRAFIVGLGATCMIPGAVRAQQGRPLIGVLSAVSIEAFVDALRKGLAETGVPDPEIEFRRSGGQYGRLPELAADLVRRKVDVIVTSGGPAPALAAKAATSTVPIVFISGSDPVKFGVVSSLNRPGANITGVVFFNATLASKRLELLRDVVPSATSVAYLVNAANPEAAPETQDMEIAARALGIQLHVLQASSESDIDVAFARTKELRIGAVIAASDPFLGSRCAQVSALAQRYAVPVIGTARDYVTLGGLVSYGTSIHEAYRGVGNYAGRILKGEKPGDLPVIQPTKFELVINLRAAKALGMELSNKVMALADEVIE